MNDRLVELQKELAAYKNAEIPYEKVTRELKFKYPELEAVSIGRGATVTTDSLDVSKNIVVVTRSSERISDKKIAEIEDWLKIRLEDSTVVVYNRQ